MEWIIIIELIISTIKECLENRNKTEIIAGLRNPGLREAAVVHRILRKEGYHGKKLRKACQKAMQDLLDASDEEIKSLVAQAEGKE